MKRLLFSLLLLAAIGTQLCSAQSPALLPRDAPRNWWPDPSTGLMWAEHEYIPPFHVVYPPMTWQQAQDYCSSLKLGGFSGWRLPTLDEAKALVYTRHGVISIEAIWAGFSSNADGTGPVRNRYIYQDSPPHDELFLKGQDTKYNDYLWTSTPSPASPDVAWIFSAGSPITTNDLSNTNAKSKGRCAGKWCVMAALCVRSMEPEIEEVSKDAQVGSPVPDVQTLKANVPLTKARLAYAAGQYQESIAQAQAALAIQPKYPPAFWGIGMSYAMLGQWGNAIDNLNSALKIDKKYTDAQAALKWAKAAQKAAKKGEKPTIKHQEWKAPEWKGPAWS